MAKDIYVWMEKSGKHFANVIHRDGTFAKYRVTFSSYGRLERIAKVSGLVGASHYALIIHA